MSGGFVFAHRVTAQPFGSWRPPGSQQPQLVVYPTLQDTHMARKSSQGIITIIRVGDPSIIDSHHSHSPS